MSHYHAVVWIDHAQARVFQFSNDTADARVLHAPERQGHLHHKAGVIGAGHAHGDPEFFKAVGEALKGATEVLVMGPGLAKQEFAQHAAQHDKGLKEKIVAVETADHLTDHQIVAHARAYFNRTDRTRPQLA